MDARRSRSATIFLSRALVETVRPFIEQCEEETSSLCKNCGSQRLYMCVNHLAAGAQTLDDEGNMSRYLEIGTTRVVAVCAYVSWIPEVQTFVFVDTVYQGRYAGIVAAGKSN